MVFLHPDRTVIVITPIVFIREENPTHMIINGVVLLVGSMKINPVIINFDFFVSFVSNNLSRIVRDLQTSNVPRGIGYIVLCVVFYVHVCARLCVC